MSSKVLVALRVPASPERAFEAFTAEIGAWWRPEPLFSTFTPRSPGVLSFEPGPDGRLIETLSSGKVFEIGRILLWEPPERLAFSWRQASFAPGQETRVEVSFEALGEETRVTVQHFGWETVPAGHVARHGMAEGYFLQRHGQWWQSLLASLAEQLSDPPLRSGGGGPRSGGGGV